MPPPTRRPAPPSPTARPRSSSSTTATPARRPATPVPSWPTPGRGRRGARHPRWRHRRVAERGGRRRRVDGRDHRARYLPHHRHPRRRQRRDRQRGGGLVRIVLDGVDVTSSTTSPFAVVQATEVVVHLADGSTNVFTDAASYPLLDAEHDEPDAAFFSDDPMTITGSGTLEVHANFQDGIVGQDTLQIDGGTIVVTAVDDAIRGNDSLVVNGGAITVAANGDGVKSDLVLTVNGGTIDVQQSYEGLEAETITINGGTIDVAADDDGVNAASDTGSPSLTVTGGTITVDAGGDGLDVNGSITMTGGTVLVDGPTADMNGALDYDGTFDISGGLFIATGSSGMAMAPSASSAQLSLLGVFATQAAGTTVTVLASDGTEVASITPTKPYSSLTMSTAALSADDTYSVVVDGTTLLTTTTDQAIGAGGMGGRGGGPGGPGGGGRP
ncbi:MAG: carbohydrate-binding domain-containing protein [Ilumatobacteraceae bacterium]